jgi:hypothetical protein
MEAKAKLKGPKRYRKKNNTNYKAILEKYFNDQNLSCPHAGRDII